jgi:endogenous inhibitor of DNA gyrase (YacG/DUF329 family)
MAVESCPSCGHDIEEPSTFRTTGIGDAVNWHTTTDCPGCKRPLIWFKEGPLAGEWRLDEAEENRRRRATGS